MNNLGENISKSFFFIPPIKIITIKYTIPPIAINNNATKLVTNELCS